MWKGASVLELTGRIFCTADVILAGLTVEVLTVASLMATVSTVSAGITLSIAMNFFCRKHSSADASKAEGVEAAQVWSAWKATSE